ncbi:MAG TPA: BON domain-containing protein [Gemmatimonadales bacterium]|nr:BON domain-containing protein [Gemmatimonadales bacterium]
MAEDLSSAYLRGGFGGSRSGYTSEAARGTNIDIGLGPGRYAGVGPRNFHRSEERIREDVCEALTVHDLDVSDLDVDVAESEVTLSGSVPDRATKREAVELAESIPGVTDVHTHIHVRNRWHNDGGGR